MHSPVSSSGAILMLNNLAVKFASCIELRSVSHFYQAKFNSSVWRIYNERHGPRTWSLSHTGFLTLGPKRSQNGAFVVLFSLSFALNPWLRGLGDSLEAFS